MNKISLFLLLLLIFFSSSLQAQTDYTSLDPENPIVFMGDRIIYSGEEILFGPQAFFIDGQITDKDAAKYKYVYNSINEAVKDLKDGTEESPMVLYIAPYVYWIDDPDDPEIRISKNVGGSPFGLEIECEWLKFQGLNPNPENVVLACNRGQTQGAIGNFTMFKIIGNGICAENITFGNYCNVDLEYPLNPEFNREKRGSAIVQAQLVYLRGDKIVARNTNFISRLNLLPFYGGDRTLFEKCHFESTDDALAPKGLYLNCSFEFYSSKPFGHTSGTGAIFLNCEIKAFTRGSQYFVKGGGQVAVVDCRMESDLATYWGWKQDPQKESKYYHYNNYFNGKKVDIGSKDPDASVDMSNKTVLDAYRFEYDGEIIYNTYNLLKGNDHWDPMDIRPTVLKAEKELQRPLTNLPTQLLISPSRKKIETGKDSILLNSNIYLFWGYGLFGEEIIWSVLPEHKELVYLRDHNDGSCTVIPTNKNDKTNDVVVIAKTKSGLEAATLLYVAPQFLDPPGFISLPEMEKKDGKLFVNYTLDMKFEDQSLISWYRCDNPEGTNPIEVAVSRFNHPTNEYILSQDDVGYSMMVSVSPQHVRCNPGDPVFVVMKEKIEEQDILIDKTVYEVDLETLSTKYQPRVIPGFWTFDCFKPEDTYRYKEWQADTLHDSWYVGPGINGAANDTGLVQATKGARLRYTPVGQRYGDMNISFTAVPAKTAGQGFSSAKAQYLDIFIKFDTRNMNGYALRLFRTTKYHNAIDCMFVKYENGKASPIGESVSTSCYRTPCYISLEVKGNVISAQMESPAKYHVEPNRPEVKMQVDMETNIETNNFGGFGFQHTGSVWSGATLIKDLKIHWDEGF